MTWAKVLFVFGWCWCCWWCLVPVRGSCDCEQELEDFRKTVDSLRWKLQDMVGIQYQIKGLEREVRLKDERLKDFGRRLGAIERRTQVVKEKHPRDDKSHAGLVGEPVSGILFNINERFSNIDLRLLSVEQGLRNLSAEIVEGALFPQLQEQIDRSLKNVEQSISFNLTKSLEMDILQDLKKDVENITQIVQELKADYEANEAIRKHAQKLRETFMEHIKQTGSSIKLEDLFPTALNSDDDEESDNVPVLASDADDDEDQEKEQPSSLEDFTLTEDSDWKEPIT